MLVNICICTFKRSGLLKKCIGSILSQEKPKDADYCVTVIDNDHNRSAEEFVKGIDSAVSIYYHVEERRGIPCARNKALKVSKEIGADLLIFIDDDEIAEKGWLGALYDVSGKYNHMAAVHGLVIPKLADDTPKNIAGLFKIKKRPEGKELTACATDNVSLPMKFVTDSGLAFDENQPLAGGEDTRFFTEAYLQGLKIYQTNSAVVFEEIPPGRCRLKWLVKRKFATGLTGAWRKIKNGRGRWGVAGSAIIQMLLYSILAGFYLVIFKGLKRNECILKSARSAGIFMGCFNVSVNSY